jgi:hypothetical protein
VLPKSPKIKKVTTSERSASEIHCVSQRLWRGVEEPVLSVAEGTSAVLIFPMLFRAFRPPKPDSRICCDTHLTVTGHIFAKPPTSTENPGQRRGPAVSLLVLPQTRHPERSASQIDRLHSACGAESKDLGGAYFPHAVRSFSTTEARQQDLLRYVLDGYGHIFANATNLDGKSGAA